MNNWQQVWKILLKYKGAEAPIHLAVLCVVLLALYFLLKDKTFDIETYIRHLIGMQEVRYQATGDGAFYTAVALAIVLNIFFWIPARMENDAGQSFRCNNLVFVSLQNMEKRLREAFVMADGAQSSVEDKESFLMLAEEIQKDLVVLAPYIRSEKGHGNIITVSYYDRSANAGGYLSPEKAAARIKAKTGAS